MLDYVGIAAVHIKHATDISRHLFMRSFERVVGVESAGNVRQNTLDE